MNVITHSVLDTLQVPSQSTPVLPASKRCHEQSYQEPHPPSPLVPTHPALVSNPSPQAVEHPQLNSKQPVTAPSNPALTTSFIQAHCLDSSMTSFIVPSNTSSFDATIPILHLHHSSPISFPA